MADKSEDGARPGGSDDTVEKRFTRVDVVYSMKDRHTHLIRTAKAQKLPSKLYKFAFLVKREISKKGMVADIKVEIISQCLVGLLRVVFPDAEWLGLDEMRPQVSQETLWHARLALLECLSAERAKGEEDRNDVVISDIDATLEFLQEEYEGKTREYIALQSKEMINYDLLWCLFPPSIDVYTNINALHEPQILRCMSYSYEFNQQTGERWFQIVGQCLNHDGEDFGWAEQELKVPLFQGTALVTSLLAYPLICHPDEASLRDRLHARGETFVKLLDQPRYLDVREYDSTALVSVRVGNRWEQDTFHASRRVMVDPERFCRSCSWMDPLRKPECHPSKAFAPAKTPSKDLMYCHYRILGFSFDQKRWCALAISRLRKPEWNDQAFDQVIMPPVKRELMRSLVSAHRTGSDGHSVFDDIIKGKGRGLIGLLSGAPGVGKTLTAEAVAEVSHRPLYAVSAGELGTDVSRVDKQLGDLLDTASSWNSVLLIDECDVFLRQRDLASVVNNALVSIFLRRLEYFQGLAILTTNRKDDIDKAFLSRIHFKFHYNSLGSKQRLDLWKSFLGHVDGLDENKLDSLATDYELNGREIKNAAFCSMLIAQSRDCTLTTDLIQEVLGELSGD
ncbi:hypothetical protein Daus18300_009187 [Diaporthe australafricana]|uniref:AAA+ ATPase domain-containing protein n=1 Tax=Diaporthe australafricana TaxID=127596 RepID=A0ABR3WFM4_9PEZI